MNAHLGQLGRAPGWEFLCVLPVECLKMVFFKTSRFEDKSMNTRYTLSRRSSEFFEKKG